MIFSPAVSTIQNNQAGESICQERKVDLKSRKRSGVGGGGGAQELSGQEKEEGSKRRGRTSVRWGGAVVGEREGGRRHSHSMIQSCNN